MRLPTTFLLLALGSLIGCSQGNSPTADLASDSPVQSGGNHELAPLPVGAPMPSLSVEGWMNGTGPSPEALAGKVVVIDIWAYW